MVVDELPPAGHNKPKDHVAMSARFLDHAQKELNNGRRFQASEKVWGAVTHMLEAIGKRRGWATHSHPLTHDINEQLAEEFGRDDLRAYIDTADKKHLDFYENERGTRNIQSAINRTKQYIQELDELLEKRPQAYTIDTTEDQARLGRLRKIPPKRRASELPLHSTHTRGFSLHHGGKLLPPSGRRNAPGNDSGDGSRETSILTA